MTKQELENLKNLVKSQGEEIEELKRRNPRVTVPNPVDQIAERVAQHLEARKRGRASSRQAGLEDDLEEALGAIDDALEAIERGDSEEATSVLEEVASQYEVEED